MGLVGLIGLIMSIEVLANWVLLLIMAALVIDVCMRSDEDGWRRRYDDEDDYYDY